MIKTLQINLNRCHEAHDLLEQSLETEKYDLAVVSEPNQARMPGSGWETDLRGDAAIWTSRRMQGVTRARGRGEGFVWLDFGETVVYSCYISPNVSIGTYDEFLQRLETSIEGQSRTRLIIVAGDFNAWSEDWGSTTTKAEGEAVVEMTCRMGLILATMARNRRSAPDGESPSWT